MAKMYPPNAGAAEGSGARGEAYVYELFSRLPDDWVVIHDCWRYYMKKKWVENYEVDFIVLVPKRGFVVVEVKNWHAAKVENGVWWFMGRGGMWVPMGNKNSPLHQAYLGSKKLDAELSHVRRFSRWYNDERREGRVEYHGLAVLLNQTSELIAAAHSVEGDCIDAGENSVPLESLYICGTAELEHDLQGKIERLFSCHPRFLPLEQNHIDQIVNYLLPSFHLKGDPVAYNRIMEDASVSLHAMLPALEESTGGIYVTGCAGSGKTWMATHELARLYRKYGCTKRMLFLCYNTALAAHVRRLPELADGVARGAIAVFTFPDLCMRFSGRKFLTWQDIYEWFRKLQSMDNESMLNEICNNIAPEQRYDYIFIDECQDFHRSWERIVRALQREGAHMYYFADENQNIFAHGAGLGTYTPNAPTRLHLHRNLRNSAEIARYSSALLGEPHRMEHLDLPGLQVAVAPGVEDVAERARVVQVWLKRLMHGKQIETLQRTPEDQQNRWLSAVPHQIVVLSPYAPYKPEGSGDSVRVECSLPLVPRITCRSHEIGMEALLTLRDEDESIIIGTTIRAFKGLEADYVILTDVGDPRDDEDRALNVNDFYVACTRAKYGLIIIPRSRAGEAYARDLLNKSTAQAGQI